MSGRGAILKEIEEVREVLQRLELRLEALESEVQERGFLLVDDHSHLTCSRS